MRVFVAGATGVIGRSLVPRLIEKGHAVTAMTRSREGSQRLASLAAEPIVCDVYDVEGLEEAIRQAEPEVVVHELTALPPAIDPRRIEDQLADNDRVRVEGTRNLVRAAVKAGASRIVAQSIAFTYLPRGGPVKSEEDPLWLDAPWPWRRTVAAVAELERLVTSAENISPRGDNISPPCSPRGDNVEGVVLRYGYFYGPGTAYAADGSTADLVRRRQLPIAGRGSGVFSFVHVDDAASATVAAIEGGRPGIYNVVDDEPSPLRDWLPVYAEALGAPRPRKVLAFLAGLAVGRYGLYYMTRQRGASNAKAKRELGWSPGFASWRTGFHEELRGGADLAVTIGDSAAVIGV